MDESQKDYPEEETCPKIIYSYDSIYDTLEWTNYSIYGEKIAILDTSGEVGHRLTGMWRETFWSNVYIYTMIRVWIP